MKFKCTKDDNGFNYIDIFVKNNGKTSQFSALVRTGSDYSIFPAKVLGVDLTNCTKVLSQVGFETIEIYKVPVDSIAIGSETTVIPGVDYVYVSELPYFEKTAILGCDYIFGMDMSVSFENGMEIEFDPDKLGADIIKQNTEDN